VNVIFIIAWTAHCQKCSILRSKSHIAQATGGTYQFNQTVTTISLGALTKGTL